MRYSYFGSLLVVMILHYQGLTVQAEEVGLKTIQETEKKETPIAVSLALNETTPRVANHFCSGALISAKHVFTIAPCLYERKKDEVVILAGSSNLDLCKAYGVRDWKMYNEYMNKTDSSSVAHDMAIIVLSDSVEGHDNNFMAALPYYKNFKLDGIEATLFGWGISDRINTSETMESIPVKLSTTPFCLENIKLQKVTDNFFPNDYFVCSVAQIRAAMKCGDKGGPIIGSNGLLIGIIFGTCPVQDDRKTVLISFHHRIWPYKEFILHVISSDEHGTSGSL